MGGMSHWFPLYFPVILDCLTRVVWTVQIPPKTASWVQKKKRKKRRTAHKAVKSTLVSKQNTAALEEEKMLCDYPVSK